MKRSLFLVSLLCLAHVAPATVDRRTPVVEAVEKVLPSVVNIGTERLVRTIYSDPRLKFRGDLLEQYIRDFFGGAPPSGYRIAHSLGSGVIVDSRGFILTNYHVIERASRIRVMLSDESIYDGVFLAGDEINDLALIKIDAPDPLPAVSFGKDDDLLLGETVVALGNPFGLAHTVTVGVLSAKDREARYGDEVLYRDILQTDAAVNPGNSGGPLLNINGELIGINVAIYQQAQNIGFAVPIKRARALLTRWFSPRLIKKMWLGFEPDIRQGVLAVDHVDPLGPAAQAGVVEGELIKALNGEPIESLYDYNRILVGMNPGDKVSIAFQKADLSEQAMELALVMLPKPSGELLARQLLGLEFSEGKAGPERPGAFSAGLRVEKVIEEGPAAKARLTPGLLVTRINATEIKSLDDVGLALENVKHGDGVILTLVSIVERDAFVIAQLSSVQLAAD